MDKIYFNSAYAGGYVKLLDPGNINQVKPFENELNKNRMQRLDSLVKSVTKIRGDLESLKSDVLNNLNKRPIDSDCLKSKMFDAEYEITNLKEIIEEELIILIRDEYILLNELQYLEHRLKECYKPLKFQIFKPLRQPYHETSTKENNAIAEFQKFLSTTGGHYGGWDEQDHLLFLRERKKYKGKKKFLSAVHCLLPDLSFDYIINHEKWFTKYESLKYSQAQAIQKWKNKKILCHTKNAEDSVEEKKVNSVKETQNERNIAERIKKWKENQSLKKLKEEEKEKEEKIKLKREEQKKREILEKKKLAVVQYKTEKLKKIQENLVQKDNELLVLDSKIKEKMLQKSFRFHNIKFMEKKKSIYLQLVIKANEKEDRWKLPKSSVKYLLPRNPKRVFQPTVIWTQHCQQKPFQNGEKNLSNTTVLHQKKKSSFFATSSGLSNFSVSFPSLLTNLTTTSLE